MSDSRSSFKSHSATDKFGRSEDEKKILYCEVCEVPCPTPLDLQDHFKRESHKQKERAMMLGGFKVEELERIMQKVKCLQDYVDETDREPVIGLEYVVEFRHPGMTDPDYDCELCGSKSKLVPMIVHLNGLKHRKAYINKHFPFMSKNRIAKEDIFQFLRRMASEIERYRGLKKFRVEPPMQNEPVGDGLKRKIRWDEERPSDDEPRRKRHFQERFDGGSGSDDELDKIARAKRVAEILQRVKPLNKDEAKAMQRAKAINQAAALDSRGRETVERRDREGGRWDFQEHEPGSRDMRTPGQKDSSPGNEDEWKRFFGSGSSAEKDALFEKLRKSFPWKSSADGGPWSQPSTKQKSPGQLADSVSKAYSVTEDPARSKIANLKPGQKETTPQEGRKRIRPTRAQKKQLAAEAKKREEEERRAAVERRAAEAEQRIEAEKRALDERREAEAVKRIEAEKRALDERVAKAKSLAESLTKGKTGEKSKTTQNQQAYGTAGRDSTGKKVDGDKVLQAKRVAEKITQGKPNVSKQGIGSFIGKLKSMQPNKQSNVTGTDPAVKQAIAEKLAQVNHGSQAGRQPTSQGAFGAGGNWNRESGMGRQMPQDRLHGGMAHEPHGREMESNRALQTDSLPWRQAQTMSTPANAPRIGDDSVVDLLENFLKQSLGQGEQNTFREGGGNRHQEALSQNQPPQYVTASGTWNLVPMGQKQQIQQAIGRGNWNAESYVLQNEPVQRVANPPFYDAPASSFGSSSINPLNSQTQGNLSFLGTQANNSARHLDSRGSGSFSSGNRGFSNDYNQPDCGSFPNIRGVGSSYPSDQRETDYQDNMYRNNPPGPGAMRMSDVAASSNWQQESASRTLREPQNQGAKYNSTSVSQSLQGYPPSSSSFSAELNSLGNADRASRSSLGDSYREGIREMGTNRAMAQGRPMLPDREMGPNRSMLPDREMGPNRSMLPDREMGKNRPMLPDREMGPNRAMPRDREMGQSRAMPMDREMGPSRAMPMDREMGPSRAMPMDREMGPSRAVPMDREMGPSRAVPRDREVGPSRAMPQDRDIGQNRAMPRDRESGQARALPQDREMGQTRAMPRDREMGQARAMPQDREMGQARAVPQDREMGQARAVPRDREMGQSRAMPRDRDVGQSRAMPQDRDVGQSRAMPRDREMGQARAMPQDRETGQNRGLPHVREMGQTRAMPQDREMGQNRAMPQDRDMGPNRMPERDVCGLTPDILNKIRGKDVFTTWAVLSKLSPYHPALEKVNISTLVNQLVENGIVK